MALLFSKQMVGLTLLSMVLLLLIFLLLFLEQKHQQVLLLLLTEHQLELWLGHHRIHRPGNVISWFSSSPIGFTENKIENT